MKNASPGTIVPLNPSFGSIRVNKVQISLLPEPDSPLMATVNLSFFKSMSFNLAISLGNIYSDALICGGLIEGISPRHAKVERW